MSNSIDPDEMAHCLLLSPVAVKELNKFHIATDKRGYPYNIFFIPP